MTRIRDAYLDFDNKPGGSWFNSAILMILFSNEQSIQISLKAKANDPRYAYMRDAPAVQRPRTDGERIYWQNGPSLQFDEIMEMLVG